MHVSHQERTLFQEVIRKLKIRNEVINIDPEHFIFEAFSCQKILL